jgi:hypothetical protein
MTSVRTVDNNVTTDEQLWSQKQDTVRLLIEELIEKRWDSWKMKFKLDDKFIEVSNVFILNRSNIYYLKYPKCVIKRHPIIFRPDNCVTELEYPNLKDNS